MKPGVYWARPSYLKSFYTMLVCIKGKEPFLSLKWAKNVPFGDNAPMCPAGMEFGPRLDVMPIFELQKDKVLILWRDGNWKGCLVSPEAIFPISHDITEAADPHMVIAKLVGSEE
jgi:hypothetical protein